MKKGFTVREKVLLAILGVLVIGALYYYVFYIPTIEDTEKYKKDNVAIEDQILAVQIQTGKFNQMEKELESIIMPIMTKGYQQQNGVDPSMFQNQQTDEGPRVEEVD